jgi:hypothetical protein
MTNIELKVEQNVNYGDWRVVIYKDGEWENEVDNNYTKKQAEHKKHNMLNPYSPVGVYL